jgi:hypothetical protein
MKLISRMKTSKLHKPVQLKPKSSPEQISSNTTFDSNSRLSSNACPPNHTGLHSDIHRPVAEILTFLRAGQHLPLKNTFYLESIEISCDSASRTHTPEMIVHQTQTVSVFVVSICLTTTPSAEHAGT